MNPAVFESIFKAYDVRGKVGSELTPEVVTAIGAAFANWLPEDGAVAVGRDMRPDSAQLAQALMDGIASQGRDVIDIGEVTSDMIYFAVGHLKLAGGAVVTASHNPGEYNGIKMCREGAKPIGVDTGLFEIRDTAAKNELQPVGKTGSVSQKDIVTDWVNHALGFIDPKKLKPLKIVVDAGNGMAGKIFPALEPLIPCTVTEMYFELDGTFPNHIANPLEPKNLVDVIAKIKTEEADVGIAFDGDGDRAVLIDELGEPLTGTVMTSLMAEYFLRLNPGATILYNAICGRVAVDTIKKNGGTGIRTKVGHSYIKDEMHKNQAVFAGEHSGHYYFRDNFMADSGLIAAVVGLALLSASGKSLSALVAPLRAKYLQVPETNFEVTDKEGTMKKISQSFEGTQDWLDGLTVNFEDSWFNIRPSNTEPLLRLNVEATSQPVLDELVAKVTKLIQE